MLYNNDMKVYRYTTEEELKKILYGDLDNIGRVFNRTEVNTHKYRENKKYLHFFKDLSSIKDIKLVRKDQTYYVCEYDIPLILLMLGRGYGYYDCSGYKIPHKSLKEYIIPVDKFSPKWLVDYKKYQLNENNNEFELCVD